MTKVSFVLESSPSTAQVDASPVAASGVTLSSSAQWWEALGYALTGPRIGADASARSCMMAHAINGSGGYYASDNNIDPPSWRPEAGCPLLVYPPAAGVDYSASAITDGAASTSPSPSASVGLTWSSGSTGFALGQVSAGATGRRHWLRSHDIYDPESTTLPSFNNQWATHASVWGGSAAAAQLISTSFYFTAEIPQWSITAVSVKVTCLAQSGTLPSAPDLAYSVTSSGPASTAWTTRTVDGVLIPGESSPWLPLSLQGRASPYSYWGNLDVQDANAQSAFDPGVSGIPGGGESVTYSLAWRYTVTRDNKNDVTPPLHQRQRTGGMDDHAMHSGPGSSTRQGAKFARGKL